MCRREVEIINEERKVEFKIENQLIMEYAVEYAEAIKGRIKDLRKINDVIKYKRVTFPCEMLCSCIDKLTACVREMNGMSSARHLSARSEASNCEIKYEKLNKVNSKSWNKFVQ